MDTWFGYPKSLLGRQDKTLQQKWIAGSGIPKVSMSRWNCLYEVGREMGHPKTPISVIINDPRNALYLNKFRSIMIKVKINDCRHHTLY